MSAQLGQEEGHLGKLERNGVCGVYNNAAVYLGIAVFAAQTRGYVYAHHLALVAVDVLRYLGRRTTQVAL